MKKMPRPLLKPQQQKESYNVFHAQQTLTHPLTQTTQLQINRTLRKPRSKAYMQALSQLDAGGHVQNQQKVDAIIHTIHQEFPEVELSGFLLGYVAICYLGKPYEVHTLDMNGQIIEHYKIGQTLPGGLEKARSIALRGGYAFIEVYIDCCRAISTDGSVSVIHS